jgi:hypothetical protein
MPAHSREQGAAASRECWFGSGLVLDVQALLLLPDLHDGGVILAERQANVVIHAVVFQVAVTLIQVLAMLAVVQLCHDIRGGLTVQIVLEINVLAGQHPA